MSLIFRRGAAPALILVCWTAWASGAPAVHDLMERMTVLHNRMEENLLKGGSPEAWESDAGALDALYAELEPLYGPRLGGTGEGWTGYCRDSREALSMARAARRAGDDAGARTAFFRLAEIREKAHAEFRPGLLKRMGRFFKRRNKETVK